MPVKVHIDKVKFDGLEFNISKHWKRVLSGASLRWNEFSLERVCSGASLTWNAIAMERVDFRGTSLHWNEFTMERVNYNSLCPTLNLRSGDGKVY